MNVLEIRELTKKFGEFIAVDNISLAVREGEIFGFLGANGAGKSTTINLVASLLRPSSGEIRILDRDLMKHSRYTKMNLGIVPQDLAIYKEMTAYENVSFFAGLYGLRGAELKERTIEALKFVGLEDKMKSYPKNFSGGMKRRLNIACAIAHRPKLIIMDEPTVGIDPHSRNYILNSVRKLNEMGCTIIYTSHYMEEVEEICTRVAIIDHGKVIAEGTKEQLVATITDVKEIRIELKKCSTNLTDTLRRIPGVRSVELVEQTVRVFCDLEVDNLGLILNELIDHDADIRSVEEQEPNLETVFLTLTGRTLRD
ncbi:ABC transporter ATP-binding protein [Paenibacillus motobuensis]|uniref:ABC transporter ATP-binding protein n=1 Tax=Paenibacillus TaxID=44249 RepID=UPI00203C02D3|nr:MULTISPECIES: ABC transporter ATP-binding protein [Paenibacillus]MCM3040522.1 ABC transporter ATP-binding protein [Paenibacillus lutimineralis]MCM3647626.1 ABC transporter ATP-binding protein [Paenibacillus motobuensis]